MWAYENGHWTSIVGAGQYAAQLINLKAYFEQTNDIENIKSVLKNKQIIT